MILAAWIFGRGQERFRKESEMFQNTGALCKLDFFLAELDLTLVPSTLLGVSKSTSTVFYVAATKRRLQMLFIYGILYDDRVGSILFCFDTCYLLSDTCRLLLVS